jgi:cation:H+ antiporter
MGRCAFELQMINLLLVCVGLGLLTLGSEALVRGALAAARRIGVSPLMAGLVIVGFGTSMPELVVSVDAALSARPDIAVGNVVGSNIANILLILGICALITPLVVNRAALARDGMTVIVASLLFVVLCWNSALSRSDALFLMAGLALYLVVAYSMERDARTPAADMHRDEAEEFPLTPRSVTATIALIVIGLIGLAGGARMLLIGAVAISQSIGVSEALIGLTLVAVGTSLPELAVSVVAALRRHADVAVGNILGSNIFNIFGILGVSALLQPLPLHARMIAFDQWVMLGAAVLLMLFLCTGMRISRAEAALLLVAYCGYLIAGLAWFP